MPSFFAPFEKNRDIGLLLLRLFIGTRLVYGVIDNVVDWNRMLEFEHFLAQFRFPVPLFSAIVSVYAQLIAGVLILLGWQIRWAALLMIVNFLVAIFAVHWEQTVEQMTPALAMLFCNILFLFYGAGRYSIDARLKAV